MTDEEAMEHNDAKDLEIEILRLENLKQQRNEIILEIADIEYYLDQVVAKDYTVDDGDDRVIATVVRGSTDKFQDEFITREHPEVWEIITRRVADKELYKQAIRDGKITEEMDAKFLISVPKKPYVLVNRIKAEADE